MQAGDFESAARHLDNLRMLSERLRQPTLMWMTAFKETGMAFMAGEPDQAEQLATAAFQLGTDSGQPDAFTIYGSQLAYIRHQQGRLGEMVSLIDQAVVENPGLPAFRPVLAAAHLDAGNDATALDLLRSAAADDFASLPLDFIWMMGISFYALVTVELRATRPASTLYELLSPYHEQVPFIGTLGFFPASLSLGGLASVLDATTKPRLTSPRPASSRPAGRCGSSRRGRNWTGGGCWPFEGDGAISMAVGRASSGLSMLQSPMGTPASQREATAGLSNLV